MRFRGLGLVAAAAILCAILVAIADAHSWSDTATSGALSAILGGVTVVDVLFAYWREGRLRIGRRFRRRRATQG